MEDMLPLLFQYGDPSAPSSHAMEELMTTLIASEDLANEPEFEGLLINPMLSAEMVAQVGQEMGFTPETLADLPEQEHRDVQMEILDESTRRLLTEEWCQDILQALNDLRLRLKRSGDTEKTAQVATLQSFLRADKSRATWPMIGLVQAILHSSIIAGFDMIEASMELLPDGVESTDTTLIDRLMQSSLAEKAGRALEKVPGLKKYMEKQVDQMWEEGVEAIRAGSLYLELYSQEELAGAVEIWAALMGYESAQEMMVKDQPLQEVSKEVTETYLVRLESYIAELFTATRLDQLRGRMDAIMRDPAYKGEWLPFIVLLREYLQDENAVQNEMGFLIGALFGEMRAADRVASKAD